MKAIKAFWGVVACMAALASCNKVNPDKVIGTNDDESKLKDTKFQYANADFYGEYVEGLSNYYIVLYNGEVDTDGNLAGDGEVLVLDIYSDKSNTAAAIPTGTYTVAEEKSLAAGTFCAGRELSILELYQPYIDGGMISLSDVIDEYGSAHLNDPSGEITGSEFYIQTYIGKDEDGDDTFEYTDFPLTADSESTVTIAKNGSNYSITVAANFTNKKVTYTYTGPIDIFDETESGEGGEGGEGGDVDPSDRANYQMYTANFTKAELDYWYDDEDYHAWTLYLGDNNIDLATLEGNGKFVGLDLYSNHGSKNQLPSGTYTIDDYSSDYIADSFYTDEDNFPWGVYYVENQSLYVGATFGSITVGGSGNNYNITATFYDDDYETACSCSYTGAITFVDYSSSTSSVATKALTKYAPRSKVFTPRARKEAPAVAKPAAKKSFKAASKKALLK